MRKTHVAIAVAILIATANTQANTLPNDSSTGPQERKGPAQREGEAKGAVTLRVAQATDSSPQGSDTSRGTASTASVNFKIEKQTLSQALMAFSQQAQRVVTASSALLEGKNSPAIEGTMKAEDALKQLLKNTGLTYVEGKGGDLTVVPEKTAASSTLNTGDGSLRLAQNSSPGTGEEGAQREGEGKNGEANAEPSVEGSPKDSAESSSDRDSASDDSNSKGIPEILVRGSRSLNVDIERTRDDVQPYAIFDREKIERSTAQSLADFLKTQLPMNTATQSLEQQADIASSVNGQINLRGLGANQTLILVDGRRLPSAITLGSGFQQADISGIPLSSIERIEVLPTSAGAIYGGQATGGVVNIVRKRDYSGLDVGAKYGNTFASDVKDIQYNVNGGAAFNEGRTSVTASAAHQESNPLFVAERSLAVQSRELLYKNSPARVTGVRRPISGTTPNICAAIQLSAVSGRCGTFSLVLDGGVALAAPVTSVPLGYDALNSDGGAALGGNAGHYNLDVPQAGDFLLRSSIRNSASINLRHSLADWLEVQLSGSKNKSANSLAEGSPATIVYVPATAPNNPFQQNVLVNVPVPGVRRPTKSDSDLSEASVSAIFHFPRNWSAILDRTWGRTRFSFKNVSGDLISPAGITALRTSGAIFQDYLKNPLDLSPYLITEYNLFGGPFTQIEEGTSLRFSGPALDLPAGTLTLTALAEHRNERTRAASVINTLVTTVFFSPPRRQAVDSFYVEGLLPIFSERNRVPFVERLDLQASMRHDSYKTTSTTSVFTGTAGSSQTPEYFDNRVTSSDYLAGLRYSPLKDVTVRASVSTGFLPPGLEQLVAIPSDTTSLFVTDPKRGGGFVSVPYTTILGGNSNLQPENSRSWSAGLIFTPRFVQGLRLSVDYTHIKKDGEINTVPSQFFLDNESLYPERITRGANLPNDPAGWAGPVTQIDASLVNIFFSSIESIDFQVDYSFQAGKFGNFYLSSIASEARQFERKLAVNASAFDSVAHQGGPLRWKGAADLSWQRGGWAASWSTQYFDSYFLTSQNPNAQLNNPVLLEIQGSAKIPSQLYHDLRVAYQFPEGMPSLLDGTVLSLGVQNVFNTSPPILATASPDAIGGSTYSTYGDPRLRRYVLSVQKSFGK